MDERWLWVLGLGVAGAGVATVAVLATSSGSTPAPSPTAGGSSTGGSGDVVKASSGGSGSSDYSVRGSGTTQQTAVLYSDHPNISVTAPANTTLIVQLAGNALFGQTFSHTGSGLTGAIHNTASQMTLTFNGQPDTITVDWDDITGQSGTAGTTYKNVITVNGG